jgi:hypothetical protein
MSTDKTQESLMTFTDLPLAVLRFQYQMARVPLQMIEDQFLARLDPDTPARLFYERSLGALDATAGRILGDPELEQRGTALVERSDALGRAAQLDTAATEKQEQADDELRAKRTKAKRNLRDARATKQREVKRARTAAEERKRAAADDAEKRTAAVKQQADEVAEQRINAAETVKREEQAQIRAAEQAVTEAAESDLQDAEAKRSDAASKRAEADQVETLAEAEKQNRKSERENDS